MTLLALLGSALAGLGPDDVVVAYNADDPEAVETALHYALARDLPEAQLCGLGGVESTRRTIPLDQAQELLIAPLQACIAALPDPSLIDAVVLVRGLPYRVDLPDGGFFVSLEAAIQVAGATRPSDGAPLLGMPQARQGSLPIASIQNPTYIQGALYSSDMPASFGPSAWYATSPRIVRGEGELGPFTADQDFLYTSWDFGRALYIVSRLDGFDHTDARALVDRSVTSDESFPKATFLCMRGSEGARGVRDAECEHALRMLDLAGFDTEWVPAFDGNLSDREVIAYFTGTANLRGAIDGLTYAPGAVVENITSFGANPGNFFCSDDGERCPQNESQTSIARMVRAGATAAHGTVAEPLNNVFPNAGFLLLYAHGYTLGEAALYNQRFLYWQNLWLGDPLAAPFAERPAVTLHDGAPVNGGLDRAIGVEHPDGIGEVVVFVDGEPVRGRLPPGSGSWPTFEELGYLPNDQVELLVVAQAGVSDPLVVPGWPAVEPVPLHPAPKGWMRGVITVGDYELDLPEPEPDPEPDPRGCGCASGPMSGAAWLLALLPLLALRRTTTQI